MKDILVTAFEPFNNQKENSSLEVIKRIKNVKTKILPVRYDPLIYKELLEKEKPDVLLLCGQAGGRSEVSIEQVAINFMYANIPDDQGIIKLGEKIINDGDDAYFATIPSLELLKALTDYPVKLSLSAGGYICNMSFYASLYYAKVLKLNTQIGFIHFPYYEGQSDAKDHSTLAIDKQVEVLEKIINNIKAY